ncbi:MAG TPA: hypothetical protein DDW81_15325 [Cryomorphaceae bacterium]|nr:hypothetical protein [Cryomorphaceae bacterium]
MKIRNLFLFMTCLWVFGLFGQERVDIYEDNISFRLPEAQAFSSIIQKDQVTNKGMVPVSVPIHTIKDRDLTLELKLNYDASGVKVNDLSTWVGLKWNLIAAPAITREVKGLPDDLWFFKQRTCLTGGFSQPNIQYVGWLRHDQVFSYQNEIRDFPNSQFTDYDYFEGNLNLEQAKAREAIHDYQTNGAARVRDTEPDRYSVNLNGTHIEFVFDEDKTPRIIGLGDYKISYNQPAPDGNYVSYSSNCFNYQDFSKRIESFTITDPQGYQYIFDQKETTRLEDIVSVVYFSFNGSGSNTFDTDTDLQLNHTVTWHISQIISPNGHLMDFTYDGVDLETTVDKPLQAGKCLSGNCSSDANRIKYDLFYDSDLDNEITYYTHTLYLTRIETENIKVDFSTYHPGTTNHHERLDILDARLLRTISVEEKVKEKSQNQFSYQLNYNWNYTSPVSGIRDEYRHRYFLSEVEIKNSDGSMEAYSFDYNLIQLPHRYNAQQDFWGYYNSNYSNSLIPTLWIYPDETGANRIRVHRIPNYVGTEYQLPGANRSVIGGINEAGVLIKIHYPTGGYKFFDYECNEYWDPVIQQNMKGPGIRVKAVHYLDNMTGADVTTFFGYNLNNGNSSGLLVMAPVFGIERAYSWDQDNSYTTYIPGVGNDHEPSFAVNVFASAPYGINKDFDGPYVTTDFEKWDYFTERRSVPYNNLSNANGEMLAYSQVTRSRTGLGKEVYEYFPILKESDRPTPVNFTILNRYPPSNSPVYSNSPNGGICDDWRMYSQGNMRLSGTEIYPFPPMSMDWADGFEHGLLHKKTMYNEDGDLLEEEVYNYMNRELNRVSVYGLGLADMKMRDGGGCWNTPSKTFMSYGKYEIVTGAGAKISSVSSSTYHYVTEPGPPLYKTSNHLTKTTTYSYVDDHNLVKQITSINSDQKEHSKIFKYVAEFAGNLASKSNDDQGDVTSIAMDDMLQANMIAAPVEELEVVDGNVVGGKLYTYKRDNFNYVLDKTFNLSINSIPVAYTPSFFSSIGRIPDGGDYYYKFHQDANYYPVMEYVAYDNVGNLAEIRQPGGSSTSYIYGYNNTLPVASVLNASANECYATSFEGFEWWDGSPQNPSRYLSNNSFTGDYYLKVPANAFGFSIPLNVEDEDQEYILSAYVKTSANFGNNANLIIQVVDETTSTQLGWLNTVIGSTNNEWVYVERKVDLSQYTNDCKLKLEVWNIHGTEDMAVDELRFGPVDAQLSTYTYEPLKGITSQVSPDLRKKTFEYDEFGRLKLVRDQDGNIQSANQYHYRP